MWKWRIFDFYIFFRGRCNWHIENSAYLEGENNKILLEHSDALTWLKRQDDSSFNFVSAIHVIEHLEFSYLYEMVGEIKVLKENGVILLKPLTR